METLCEDSPCATKVVGLSGRKTRPKWVEKGVIIAGKRLEKCDWVTFGDVR